MSILYNLVREIPGLRGMTNNGQILKYIDIVYNGDPNDITSGNIELVDKEDLKELLQMGFYEGKIKKILPALNVINNSFNKKNLSRFTNLDLADNLVNKYGKIYGWHPTDKFLFPCNRYGNFAIKVIIKLMNSKSMKKFIKDEYQRYKYIIENQICITEEGAVNNFIYTLLVDNGKQFSNKIFSGNFLKSNKLTKNKFTAIFIDPEYISSIPKRCDSSTYDYTYQDFILKSTEYSDVVVGITPANWMQTNSSKLKKLINFRNYIKEGNHLKLINYYDLNSDYVNDNFLSNNGGISTFIYDKNHNGECFMFDKIVDLSKLDIIPTKIDNLELLYFLKDFCAKNGSLNDIFDGSCGSLRTKDTRLFSRSRSNSAAIRVSKRSKDRYGVKGREFLFCDNNALKQCELKNKDKWKVLVAETCSSAGKGLSSNISVSNPGELYTNSFGVFIVDSKNSAESLVSYLKTEFVNETIGKFKIKNHINRDILKYIPKVPLNIKWTNSGVKKYLKIDKYEKTKKD